MRTHCTEIMDHIRSRLKLEGNIVNTYYTADGIKIIYCMDIDNQCYEITIKPHTLKGVSN